MSSDSEMSGSPDFIRGGPTRGTVAKKCREFYLKRLERTTTMQKRWSLCEVSSDACTTSHMNSSQQEVIADSEKIDPVDNGTGNTASPNDHPLRKCRSSLDLAMSSLRKEISSLIAQDNDLFRQLLSLHDSIAELRERQRSCYSLYQDDEDDDEENIDDEDHDGDGDREDSPSLESLSDNGDLPETSPESTLSCRSSSLSSDSTHCHHHHPRHLPLNVRARHRLDVTKKRHKTSTVTSDEPRPLIFIDKSKVCFRCRKVAPPYRRAHSITNFYYCSEDMDSYDSGIHLQGSHSDSDHEIFV